MKQHKFALFLAAAFILGLLGYALMIMGNPSEYPESRLPAAVGVVACFVFCGMVYPQRIVIRDGELKILSGFVTMRRVKLGSISRVYPGKGWPLSHTLYPVSGWRLSVGKAEVLVIPQDEEGFFEELERQAPQLRRYGNELRGE